MMKRLIAFGAACLLAASAFAQGRRCDVRDFYVSNDIVAENLDQHPSAATMNQQDDDYVDLGLPSGTKWKKKNEPGFFTFDQARSRFPGRVPEKWQWQELMSYCEWQWTDGGYKVIGRNGKSIFLPANGVLEDGDLYHTDCGLYWTSTEEYDYGRRAWRLGFSWNEVDLEYYSPNFGRSVRLIKH